jgi:hypothetical protein
MSRLSEVSYRRRQTQTPGRYDPLALTPGKTGRLPASDRAAMPFVVERSFETASDIMTGPITRHRHRLGCSQAPASRTANEEEIIIQLSSNRLKLAGKAAGPTMEGDLPFATSAVIDRAPRRGRHIHTQD